MSSVSLSRLSNGTSTQVYGPFIDPHTAAGAQAVNRSCVAALAFLVWDIFITVEDEVQYIWPRKWTYTKIIYFVARYLSLMVEVSILLIGSELTPHFHFTFHDCFIWQVFQGASAAMIVVSVDTILILRIFALFNDNRSIRAVVCFLFFMEIAGIVVGLALSLPGITYDDVCLVVGVPAALIIYGAATIMFQTCLFALSAYKFVKAVHSGWGNVPLVRLLMRDGTWAFILLFLIYVGQLSLYSLKNRSYAGVLYAWLLTGYSFCGYRILINLAKLAAPPENAKPAAARAPRTAPTNTNIEFTTHMLSPGPELDIANSTQEEFHELSPTSWSRRVRLDHHYPQRPAQHDEIEIESRPQRLMPTSQISTMVLPQ